jgi:anti-sigma factor RsiW
MNEHSKAQSLIQSGTKIAPQERVWLHSHLETCPDCCAYAAMQKELLAELPLVYAAAPLSRNEVYDRHERIQARLGGRPKLAGLFHLSRGLTFAAAALIFLLVMLTVVPGLLPDPAPLPLADATQTPLPVTATPSITPEPEAVIAPTAVPTEAPLLPLRRPPSNRATSSADLCAASSCMGTQLS